jgi:hypothetical protein
MLIMWNLRFSWWYQDNGIIIITVFIYLLTQKPNGQLKNQHCCTKNNIHTYLQKYKVKTNIKHYNVIQFTNETEVKQEKLISGNAVL